METEKTDSEMNSPVPIDDFLFFDSIHIEQDSINSAVARAQANVTCLTSLSEVDWLLKAVSLTDLTSLGNTDTMDTITDLCKQALDPLPKRIERRVVDLFGEIHITTAAVCVYPAKILDAKLALDTCSRPDFTIAAVAGGFPSGQFPLETRVQEVAVSVDLGAKEIDIVIDRSLVLTQQWKKLYDEIVAMVSAGKGCHVKVILSTGELGSLENVYKASYVAMLAGAQFIKTSTGKESVNATLPVAVVMCRAIRAYYDQFKKTVGFKPAGGIRTHEDALMYMMVVKLELGEEVLVPSRFRLGASTLLVSITERLTELTKEWPEGPGPK